MIAIIAIIAMIRAMLAILASTGPQPLPGAGAAGLAARGSTRPRRRAPRALGDLRKR